MSRIKQNLAAPAADTGTQIFMTNQISRRQKEAIMVLARLQFQGITETQVLSVCRIIKVDGSKLINSQYRRHDI